MTHYTAAQQLRRINAGTQHATHDGLYAIANELLAELDRATAAPPTVVWMLDTSYEEPTPWATSEAAKAHGESKWTGEYAFEWRPDPVHAIEYLWVDGHHTLVTVTRETVRGLPDAAQAEPLSHGETVTSWHTVRLFDGLGLFDPDVVVRQYEVEHPAECGTLPAGAVCWFEHLEQRSGPAEWPTGWPAGTGTYRLRRVTRIVGGREEPEIDDVLEVEPVIDEAADRAPDPLEANDAWSYAQSDDDRRALEGGE